MAGQFTKYTGTITGQVGSLITVLNNALLPRGWTSPFTGVNTAVYLSSAATFPTYCNVQDNAPGVANESWVNGYDTCTAVNTGTSPYPAAGSGIISPSVAAMALRKSASADGTARNYVLFADAATWYMFVLTGDTGGIYQAFGFGLFDSTKASDPYAHLAIGRNRSNAGNANYECLDLIEPVISNAGLDNTGAAHRSYTGVVGAVGLRRVADEACVGTAVSALGIGLIPFPNNPDGKIYVSPHRLFETSEVFRGVSRGLWSSCHPVASFNDGDTWSGVGTLAGKTFYVVKSSGNGGLYVLETSATLSVP